MSRDYSEDQKNELEALESIYLDDFESKLSGISCLIKIINFYHQF